MQKFHWFTKAVIGIFAAVIVLFVGLLFYMGVSMKRDESSSAKQFVFGNNPETIQYIKDLDSNYKEVIITPSQGKFIVLIKAQKSGLWGGKTDWLLIATNFHKSSEAIFTNHKSVIEKLRVEYESPGTDKYGNNIMAQWASLEVGGQEVEKANWGNINWLQYTGSFVKLRATNRDSHQWLKDFCDEYSACMQ